METVIKVDFRHNVASESKADFYSFGEPLHDEIFNHKGLEEVRHEGETCLFKFASYSDAMVFMQYVDSIGIDVHM